MAFFVEFLRHPVRTGAVVPFSRKIVDKMLTKSNVRTAKTIVELGCGEGAVTEQILLRKHEDALFFGMEINPVFAEKTKKRCADAIVYNDSASHMMKYLKKHGQKSCDCVISTLPWAAFHPEQQDRLLSTIVNSVDKKGRFLTLAYNHGLMLPSARRFRVLLESSFSKVERSETFLWNLPPAFVYSCIK